MTRRESAAGAMVVLGILALPLACDGPEAARAPAPTVKTATGPSEAERVALRADAARVFAERCASCHGVGGAGNGIDSDTLTPRPRNFQDPGWQRSVKNRYLEQIIVEGGEAVGKAASMPAHPDLASQQALVQELRKTIRNFAR